MSADQVTLEEGVNALHQEAGGLLGVEVIRHGDAMALILASAAGDARASLLLRALGETLEKIRTAPRRSTMLCASCSRPLSDGKFAVVVAMPEIDHPAHGLTLAVCTRCATTIPAITEKAATTLREIWPDLRRISISSTAGHA